MVFPYKPSILGYAHFRKPARPVVAVNDTIFRRGHDMIHINFQVYLLQNSETLAMYAREANDAFVNPTFCESYPLKYHWNCMRMI